MAVRATLHKNWKDSAGIILLSGAFKYARTPTPLSNLHKLEKAPLIVPLDETISNEEEWQVALVKRGSKTGFYANSYVFPGGRLDKADSSPEWLELFRRFSSAAGPTLDPFRPILALREHSNTSRLPLYGEVPEGPIMGEVACRICAVRELFEEAGVLLAREEGEVGEVVGCVPGTFPPAVKALSRREMGYWRERVHENAEEFLNLCSELKCVPDIWSLLEWSDWLTPRNLHVRYDTLFYLCCINSLPTLSEDGSEIVDSKWYTPSKALQLHSDCRISLTPPQFAELHFLKNLGPLPCLQSYALKELLSGALYRRTAVRILTKDRVILSLINPDDLYPVLSEELAVTSPPPHLPQSPTLTHVHLHPSQSPTHEYDCPTHTADELRELSTKISRMELHGKGKFSFHDTVLTDKASSHIAEYVNYKANSPITSRL